MEPGRTARSLFSIQHIRMTTSSTAITPPRPGCSASPNRVICASCGLDKIPAITPPMASEPPNTFAVLTPTRMFMMANTALPKIPRIPNRFGYCVAKSPTISGRLRILMIPVISPEAINAGISGIKTFASCRSASLMGALYLAFACALVRSASSIDTLAPPPISARMASTTCAAFPGPTIS